MQGNTTNQTNVLHGAGAVEAQARQRRPPARLHHQRRRRRPGSSLGVHQHGHAPAPRRLARSCWATLIRSEGPWRRRWAPGSLNQRQRRCCILSTRGKKRRPRGRREGRARRVGVQRFLVLDEADRVLDVNFEEELRVIFGCLPKKRQTFLFSATMSDNLRSLLELSGNKSYFFEAYEGFKTVETLKQEYIHVPPDGKELHLWYLLSVMKEKKKDPIRSAIVFVSTCRDCQYLDLLLEELGYPAVALNSHKSQAQRLLALNRFKSGQVPVLLATDVGSRGLDIQTVDLVINYDMPMSSRDYIHRVGRTARASRGGLAISFVTQKDICLLHEIEDVVGKQLEAYECSDKEVTKDITKVFKARRLAKMRRRDEGHDEKVEARKEQKKRDRARKRKHED